MSIRLVQGNILNEPADAIVIPVNTVGVPGAGLAKAWAALDPAAANHYKSLCQRGQIRTGRVFVPICRTGFIWLLFPTKQHWRNPSRIEWVDQGLVDLRRAALELRSLALPALGCGLGGLPWDVVWRLIESHLGGLTIPILVYPPKSIKTEQGG
jgi:O-acetyl-ADP-ribose deacetylase (regulator of RNase III)